MKLINETLMQEFRESPFCECCYLPTFGRADPHHVECRGMGGANRLDIRINLIGLRRLCHNDAPKKKALMLKLIAKRERTTVEDIVAVVAWLKRLPKGLSKARLKAAVKVLTTDQQELAIKTLEEHQQTTEGARGRAVRPT